MSGGLFWRSGTSENMARSACTESGPLSGFLRLYRHFSQRQRLGRTRPEHDCMHHRRRSPGEF